MGSRFAGTIRSAGSVLMVISGALSLWGCTEAAKSLATNDPIVVIGVRAMDDQLNDRIADDVYLFWWPYDRASDTPHPQSRTRDFSVGTDYFGRAFRGQPPLRGATYSMRQIEPGDYVLGEISFVKKPMFGRTVYMTTTSLTRVQTLTSIFGSQSQSSDRTARLTANAAYRFTVKAGDVIYIGDFVIAGRDFPTRVLRIQRDDEAARDTLLRPEHNFLFRDNKELVQKLVFRDPTTW